jgi:4-azaleucine resistance transporter AzlC
MTGPAAQGGDDAWAAQRRAILRDSMSVGVAVGVYGVSFGALGVASGFSAAQTVTLSLLMFTGASQFALIGVMGAGGGPVSAVITALMLGVRNTLYALRLAPSLRVHGWRRLVAAQITIDESTAMALARDEDDRGGEPFRLAFWATGLSVYVCWNVATVVGALAVNAIGDPRSIGLDAAIPASFLALLWPRLRGREHLLVAAGGALVAIVLTPVLRPGLPVLAAALVALLAALRAADALPPVREAARDTLAGEAGDDGASPTGGPA